MALELSEVIVPYKEFYGRNVDRMPELIAEGRVPLSTAGIMERRLNSTGTATAWKDNYFDSDDAIVYHPNGNFKIVRGAPFLRSLTSASNLANGALVLSESAYASADGAEFKRKDKGLILDQDLTAQQAKEHPVWLALVPDKALLGQYVDGMFAEMGKRFSYDDAMGVYLAGAQKTPAARALCFDGLESRSLLNGRVDLDNDLGRLVGVAPEAQSAPTESDVRIVLLDRKGRASDLEPNQYLKTGRYTLADVNNFDMAVRRLSEFVKPELLEDILEMRRKL